MKNERIILAAILTVLAAGQALAQGTPMEVKKTNGCGWCLTWVERMEENAFARKATICSPGCWSGTSWSWAYAKNGLVHTATGKGI